MPIPQELLDKYRAFLIGTKGRSENTVRVYSDDRAFLATSDDLATFDRYLELQNVDYDQLDRRFLRRYLAWLATSARGKRGGYARVSVARKLVSLRAFYRFLQREGLVKINPVPKGSAFRVKTEKRLPDFLTENEMNRLLEAPDLNTELGVRDLAILEMLYSSGVRLSELAALDLDNVDMEAREAKVLGKGSKERIVLLGGPAVQALQNYMTASRPLLSDAPTNALFLNRYGGRLSRRSIQKIVKKGALQAAISPRTHTHSMRHTFATHMLEGGADLRIVQELLGHSSPATTQIYTHVTQRQARKVYMASHPRANGTQQPTDAP